MIETIPSGTVLHGRYRIERVLGSGGFGHVYLAVDLATHQQYAVKEYLVTGPSGEEQLKHEATVLSQLHHANLPAFQDAFIERGRYYVVLNYIEGNDLTDLIRVARQRNEIVPLARIMHWILAVCDAVMFLHSQRPIVIHRDIKPDNIRITSDGTAILVDMGNAKAAADGARTLFFIRHQGTPGYAPPEQYPGGSGTDARSDVYALGGTLYFALTATEPPSVSLRNQSIQQGKADLPSLQERLANNPPEEDENAHGAKQFRLGVSKPAKPAPRHSRHVAQLGTLPPKLLQELNRIIQRAMAMKPKDRYAYVADFAADLKKVAEALPPPPPPLPSVDPHSTQPDLPMLYEAIQAAKENAQRESPDALSKSSPAMASCPRCNAPLVPQAIFCPRCGTSLSGAPRTNISNSVVSSPQTSMSEQRMHAAPQKTLSPRSNATQAQVQTVGPDKANMPTLRRTPAPFIQNTPPTNPVSQATVVKSNAPPPRSGRTNIVIFIAIALIVLIIIIALFLASRGPHVSLPTFLLTYSTSETLHLWSHWVT